MTDNPNSRTSSFGRIIRVDPTGRVTQQRTMATTRSRPIALTQRRSGLPLETVGEWKMPTPNPPNHNFLLLLKSMKTTDPTTNHVIQEMIASLNRPEPTEWTPYVWKPSFATIGSKSVLDGESLTCQIGVAGICRDPPILHPFGPDTKSLMIEPVSLEWIDDSKDAKDDSKESSVGRVDGMWQENGTIVVTEVFRGDTLIEWGEMELPFILKLSGKIPLLL